MASQAFEQLQALGGVLGLYTPHQEMGRLVLGLPEPVRRTDSLGNQAFLTKTYDLYFVKSDTEGIESVKAGYDTFAVKLQPSDLAATVLRITKIHPEWDHGMPGDGVGMWHVEAVI